eukprot:TRINITY_DN11732_c0_g1_i1.p1 TRINITY_DN11732_c0_g1~~TRINITY_DN11732_c0_g1_i1.p1  ORF type:complete len:586 (+),score=80.34 TRINITY_DN11732_c0_g1_i1:84-1841(+)
MKLFLACLAVCLGAAESLDEATTDAISMLLEPSEAAAATTVSAEQTKQKTAQPSEISMLLARHAPPDSEKYQDAHADLNNPHVAHVAGALTDLLKEEGAAATRADQTIIDTMITVLNVTMRGRLFQADTRAQQTINYANSNISACGATHNFSLLATTSRLSKSSPQDQQWIGALPSWYDHYFESYAECKRFEDDLLTNSTNCSNYCLNETTEICASSPDCSQLSCTEPSVTSGSSYRSYVLSQVNRVHHLLNGIERPNCSTHISNIQNCYANCLGIVVPVLPNSPNTLPTCCAPRQQAETLQCQNLLAKRRTWLLYDGCYDSKVASFNSVVAQELSLVPSRKGQMRAILRMICLVQSFGPEQATRLRACMDARYYDHADVLAMNLTVPAVPPKQDTFTCSAAEMPGTPEWDQLHYGGLPTGLQVCPETNCQAACNASSSHYVTHWNLTMASVTTTTTTITHGRVDCLQQTSSYGMQWDMHSVQSPTVSALPSSDMFSIFVYVQDALSSDTTSPNSVQCGILTSVVRSVDCSHVAPSGGQYLRLFGAFNGVVTSGTANPSWCGMTIDGTPATTPTTGGVATSTVSD